MNTIPILDDILDDHAPYPYTLSAFVAYLSDNHCLEVLEFIFETRRYRRSWSSYAQSLDDGQRLALHQQWLRLLQTHIVTGAPREINITNAVRENLLSSVSGLNGQNHGSRTGSGSGSGDDNDDGGGDETLCPDPGYLDPAENQMLELLNDSILQRFVKSCSEPGHMQPSVISDINERGTRSYTSEVFSDDTDCESRRQAAAAGICQFPSPDPSDEDVKSVPLKYRRSRSWSWSMSNSDPRRPFKSLPLSQPSSRTKLNVPAPSTSAPQQRTIKLDDSPPRITFHDERPVLPPRRKHGSMSSNATGTRSLCTSPEDMHETAELVKTRTSPANTPEVGEQHPQRQGQRRRWHRLPTTSGFLRHFKKVSNS